MRILIWMAILSVGLAFAGAQSKTASASDLPLLPSDINPETYSRYPPINREDMKDWARKYYDEQSAPGVSATPFFQRGPQHMYLYSPALVEAMRVMGTLREKGSINSRLTETAILVVARELNHQFIWTQHEPAARRSGVDEATIDAIKYTKAVTGLGEKETVIIQYGRQLMREKKISSDLFAKAVGLFGRQGVVELTAIMGNYVAVGMMLDAANQQLPPSRPALLPAR